MLGRVSGSLRGSGGGGVADVSEEVVKGVSFMFACVARVRIVGVPGLGKDVFHILLSSVSV